MSKMYDELATWWQLISPPEEYEQEFDFFEPLLAEAAENPDASLLELGSGGGNNALYLKKMFPHVTLTDLSPQMLAISRELNPECEHISGDMRTLRLDRTFDAVFVHDAIDYMTTTDDLRRAMETAFLHCKPGGTVLFVPDHLQETFEEETDHGGVDGDGRSLRFLEWTYDPDETDTTYTVDYVYALREGNEPTRVEHDQHICGLYSRAEWMRLANQVGFEMDSVGDPFGRDVFIAHRPDHSFQSDGAKGQSE